MIEDSAQRLAESLAAPQQPVSARWRWGTVASVGGMGTMDVEVGGTVLHGVRAARHVMGAKPGDRVRVMHCGTEAMVDAVRAASRLMSLPAVWGFAQEGGQVSLDAGARAAWLSALGMPDTPWATLAGNSADYVRWRCKAGIVFVELYYTSGAGLTTASKTFGVIPEGYRPTRETDATAWVSADRAAAIWVNPGGAVKGRVASGSSSVVYGTVSYPLG